MEPAPQKKYRPTLDVGHFFRMLVITFWGTVLFLFLLLGVPYVAFPTTQTYGGASVSPDGSVLVKMMTVIKGWRFGTKYTHYEVTVYGEAPEAEQKRNNYRHLSKPSRTLVIPGVEGEKPRGCRGLEAYEIVWKDQNSVFTADPEGWSLTVDLNSPVKTGERPE